jgi:hypothetical protein
LIQAAIPSTRSTSRSRPTSLEPSVPEGTEISSPAA